MNLNPRTLALLGVLLLSTSPSFAANSDGHIAIDQFGYRPNDSKVAVVRNPVVGYDAADKFVAGASYEVRNAADGSTVFSGMPKPWQNGKVQPSSGDNGWWFDFSALETPGSYYVYDKERDVRSAVFNIGPDVYKDVLRAAMRMFFYQRSGMAKQPPNAEKCWVDAAAYVGQDQDLEAHDITDRNNRSKFRNLSGGWFDAGDTNKYVTFAAQPVHELLTAYEQQPRAFTDDFNIPESGNGVPDVLDEVKWEIDWLKRMQYSNGSVALKVGEIVYGAASPPSRDGNARFYVPACTSSTIAAAGMFAHAAYVFGQIPALRAEAQDLQLRALAAWNNYQHSVVKQVNCDMGVVHSGIADWSLEAQNGSAVVAAIYLYALTDASGYQDYVRTHLHDARPYHDTGWSRYNPEQGDALLFYTGVTHADAALRHTILADKMNDVRANPLVYEAGTAEDLYRAYMHDGQYHWGSNNPRAGYGNSNMDMLGYLLDSDHAAAYRERALGVLHYFHGVNPFTMVYLSNMYKVGASRSVNELFHGWYAQGTRWSDALKSDCGPPPGYVVGGPNANAAHDGVPESLVPPIGQPLQKSYRDWNGTATSPQSAYAISEPAIYYQSAYVKLLSKFIHNQ